MTLKQIETRLHLFPEYLRYRTDNWERTAWGKLHTLRHHGYIMSYQLMTFDQWLFQHKHEDLVDPLPFLLNCVR